MLGDICSFIEQGISPAQADWLSRQTGYRLRGSPPGHRCATASACSPRAGVSISIRA